MVKLSYVASTYASHFRAARSYCDLISEEYKLVKDPKQADIVVLHVEPHNFENIYKQHPCLANKYVIGCCVWEASQLPDSYKRPISYVQELWTCSRYCCKIFEESHAKVVYMPYVAERDTSYSGEDYAAIKSAIHYQSGCVYFLTITTLSDKRKNFGALLRSFQNCSRSLPQARLIVKAGRHEKPWWGHDPQVICLAQELTDSQISAMYRLADVYISTHHSEGWGLTLSDAMLFKKPVIATGYSGSLEFMNQANSFLLDFREENIKPEDCFGLFNEGMKWAYVSGEEICKKINFYCDNHESELVKEKIRKASEDISAFSPITMKQLLHVRLSESVRSL